MVPQTPTKNPQIATVIAAANPQLILLPVIVIDGEYLDVVYFDNAHKAPLQKSPCAGRGKGGGGNGGREIEQAP